MTLPAYSGNQSEWNREVKRQFDALERRTQTHFFRTYIEEIPGFTEGSNGDAVANANALNAYSAANPGKPIYMRGGALYRLAGILPKGSLVFEGSNKPTIFMPAADFTRANNLEAGRYAANGTGIRVFGGQNDGSIDGLSGTTAIDKIVLANFIIQCEELDGRNVGGIYARNATDLTLDGIEIFGLPLGIGIQLDSVRGNSRVENIHVHDCYTDTTLTDLVTGAPNITGLGMGGNEVALVANDGITVRNIRVVNLMCGPAFQEANSKGDATPAVWSTMRANQSDGINISGVTTRNCKFSDIHIDTVGEGIDCFGRDNQFSNVHIRGATIFGVKLTHGAQRNAMDNVNIENVGLGGVIFQGSDQVQDVSDNRINNLTVNGINPDGTWSAGNGGGTDTSAASTFGVQMAVGSTYATRRNRVTNVSIDGGGVGLYGYLDTTELTGTLNYGLDVETRNTVGERVLVQGVADGRVRQLGGTAFVKQVDSTGTVIA